MNKIRGRSTQSNIPNRFEKVYLDLSGCEDESYFDSGEDLDKIPTIYYNDYSRSVLARNESPDLGHEYSINPYRGCEHGCIYCYARPTHEYLGFSSGLDFETKIMVKKDAPKLLEDAFRKKSWKPQTVLLSGNTDCYQPIERKLKITRQILEVFLKYRNPVAIITKNALLLRDMDILKELAKLNLVRTVISMTSLRREIQRRMEPRTSSPEMRLNAISELSANGIPIGINVAPIIPGLTDEEMPMILKSAAHCGATYAGKILLRLPFAVKEIFVEWIKKEFPERANKVINRVREMRGGELYNNEFGKRMRGEGQWAETFDKMFHTTCRVYGLNNNVVNMSTDLFLRNVDDQQELFG